MRTLMTAIKMTIVLTLLTGIVYPMAVMGNRASAFPLSGARQPDHARRHRWSAPHLIGQNFARRGYFHPPPFGRRRQGLRREQLRRVQPRADQSN